jgi:hypothetical protein
VGHYTKRRGGASRLGTSVAVHHSSSEQTFVVASRVSLLLLSVSTAPAHEGRVRSKEARYTHNSAQGAYKPEPSICVCDQEAQHGASLQPHQQGPIT